MRLYFAILILLTLFSCSYANDNHEPEGAEHINNRARTLWTVTDYFITKNSIHGDSQAQSMMFKPLDMSDTSITFDGRMCHVSEFEWITVDLGTYVQKSLSITVDDMGISDQKVEIIKTDCDIPGFSEIVRFADMRLMVVIDGICLFLEPDIML